MENTFVHFISPDCTYRKTILNFSQFKSWRQVFLYSYLSSFCPSFSWKNMQFRLFLQWKHQILKSKWQKTLENKSTLDISCLYYCLFTVVCSVILQRPDSRCKKSPLSFKLVNTGGFSRRPEPLWWLCTNWKKCN